MIEGLLGFEVLFHDSLCNLPVLFLSLGSQTSKRFPEPEESAAGAESMLQWAGTYIL